MTSTEPIHDHTARSHRELGHARRPGADLGALPRFPRALVEPRRRPRIRTGHEPGLDDAC